MFSMAERQDPGSLRIIFFRFAIHPITQLNHLSFLCQLRSKSSDMGGPTKTLVRSSKHLHRFPSSLDVSKTFAQMRHIIKPPGTVSSPSCNPRKSITTSNKYVPRTSWSAFAFEDTLSLGFMAFFARSFAGHSSVPLIGVYWYQWQMEIRGLCIILWSSPERCSPITRAWGLLFSGKVTLTVIRYQRYREDTTRFTTYPILLLRINQFENILGVYSLLLSFLPSGLQLGSRAACPQPFIHSGAISVELALFPSTRKSVSSEVSDYPIAPR